MAIARSLRVLPSRVRAFPSLASRSSWSLPSLPGRPVSSLPLVIVAAASGAILGDNRGFWVGREGGSRLLRRNARFIRLNERKLKLGLYLFRKHGGKVVFFGRFLAVLRMWAALLAGTHRMEWNRFLLFNARWEEWCGPHLVISAKG